MGELLLVNGPNLGRLGVRQPELYGRLTLADIVDEVREVAGPAGWSVTAVQSDAEGDLVRALYEHRGSSAAIVNPGALMMAGWSLRDALESYSPPWIEVHISNVWARESFRHHSILSALASGVVVGLGPAVYRLAACALIETVSSGLLRVGLTSGRGAAGC